MSPIVEMLSPCSFPNYSVRSMKLHRGEEEIDIKMKSFSYFLTIRSVNRSLTVKLLKKRRKKWEFFSSLLSETANLEWPLSESKVSALTDQFIAYMILSYTNIVFRISFSRPSSDEFSLSTTFISKFQWCISGTPTLATSTYEIWRWATWASPRAT